jgi:hypothetical protein
MSIAKHHNEWLSLLDISGPFLSLPVLMRVFPQGLEAHDAESSREARLAYEEWLDNQQGLRPELAIHTLWVQYVLERLLEFSNETVAEGVAISTSMRVMFAEHGEALQPDMVLHEPGNPAKPSVLVQIYPIGQNLIKTVAERRWKATPAMRMMELLRATGVRLGLVTNGEEWMLIDAPRGMTTAFVSWYAGLWFEEPITLRSFRSLLNARRFFSVEEKDTLEGMLADSVNEQQEVTEQLGYQVRRAVEVLIRSIDRADQDRGRKLLQGIRESELYEAALTVMMRLVFLFSAEERGLLLLGDPLYDQHYAVSTLRAQLREIADHHGEEVLERRFDAWCRVLATFRAVYSGIQHDRLRLPAYGGSLFSPERFPFLEGHSRDLPMGEDDQPLPINNRTVLHLLEALQILRMPMPGGGKEPRRLSFRSLDVEQIGHVYEGLLDHTAVRATEPVLGLIGSRESEPEIGLSQLLTEQAKGQDQFAKYLAENTRRSESAIKKNLSAKLDNFQIQHLKSACGNDLQVFQQVQIFAGLIREDDFEMPMVIMPGDIYVTAGATRRSTGTHYTPRSLTEPIVQLTLEPLVYVGPAEGTAREEWVLHSPAEILSLKVCDMAMGSAGFLVQTDRYLADRLLEAWAIASEGEIQITPDGLPSKGLPGETLLPKDEDERMILARRLVADRCLYGVDKNPLAVEIAKLSLWLTTMAKGRPFSFLDHALKCGDALVGASAEDFLRWAHGGNESSATLFDEQLQTSVELARQKRHELEAFEVKDVRDSTLKTVLLTEADAAMTHIKRGCDLLVGARLMGLSNRDVEEIQLSLLFPYMAGDLDGEINADKHPDAAHAVNAAKKERVFHWEFEFPEVFQHGGFNALVGNPPFLGGRNIYAQYGEKYVGALHSFYPSSSGGADLSAYFFLRAFDFTRKKGTLGLIATNTVAQGDTRLSGLEYILNNNGEIYSAINTYEWPGAAAVYVSIIHIIKGAYQGVKFLDHKPVDFISSLLDSTISLGEPKRLEQNNKKSFQGSIVLGMGFILEPENALSLIETNSRNQQILFPYLNGEDLNSRFDQSPSRWVINFGEMTEEQAQTYSECFQIVKEKVYPERITKDAKKYPRMVYEWWKFWNFRSELYRATEPLQRIIVRARVSKTHAPSFVPKDWVLSDQVVAFAYDDNASFAVIQSILHEIWAWKYSSTLKTDLRYSPTDCFQTFPFPETLAGLEKVGEDYYNYRHQIMRSRREGLTSTYNRFHKVKESAEDIVRLRKLHVDIDNAVVGAYQWSDLDLAHGFHETAQGIRYTISESARREVLSRLLKLNHARWEEEQKHLALEDEKPKSKSGKKKNKKVGEDPGQYGMF